MRSETMAYVIRASRITSDILKVEADSLDEAVQKTLVAIDSGKLDYIADREVSWTLEQGIYHTICEYRTKKDLSLTE